MLSFGFETTNQRGLTFDTKGIFSDFFWKAEQLKYWTPAFALAVILFLLQRRIKSTALYPGFVLGSAIIINVILYFTGLTLDEASEKRWLLDKVRFSD